MNKWLPAGLIVLAILAGALALRSCKPEETPVAIAPEPPREVFHASKPLQVEVVPAASTDNVEWLERELRFVLARGKMRIASRGSADVKAFVLRIALPAATPGTATLSLLAPDGASERQLDVAMTPGDRLATVQTLVQALPKFLGATIATTHWSAFLGTTEPAAYEGFLIVSSALLDARAQGFTQPAHSRELSRNVEQLEALTKRHPQFARAQGLLAIAYLGLGGADQAALTQIADAAAKRALALDDSLADAQSAMGLARLRRGEWIAARERFDAALVIDSNSIPALEGLGCLLTEVGRPGAALPIAAHAIAMQPGNAGAQECLAYARLATHEADSSQVKQAIDNIAVAHVVALSALLAGDTATAEQTLMHAAAPADDEWIKPLLRAATNKKATPEALRAITRAASDGQIDAATEVMGGAALRQSDFVFNRMSRLQKQREAMPLRVLWMPQTDFLRKHPRFEQLVTVVDLGSYWQENGRPEICEKEPKVYGCSLRPSAAKSAAQQKAPR